MKNKYTDTSAIIQVIGNIYNNISLLDNEKYSFIEEDFCEDFHKIVFGTMYNLHLLGAKNITLNAINDYLLQRPKSLAVYKNNRGDEYLTKISENIQFATFDYYYQRMKKMTLLRMYDKIGLDLKWLYDADNILDAKKKQIQEDWLDNTPLEDIAETIDNKISEVKLKYVDGANAEIAQAGDGVFELLEQLKESPEYGVPLFGPLVNTIFRGARLKKFYLRSAPTGVGKTRSMIADACYVACDEIYNSTTKQWEKNGLAEPTVFITTEMEVSEIQTLMLAFLSDVNESHLLTNSYYIGEWERVTHAAEILKRCPIYIQELHDFSLQDIENTLKFNIHEHGVKYLFHDYIHTSLKILTEIGSRSGVKNLREDNILFLIGVKLKDLANQYGVFIMSATQLNGDYQESKTPDQNLLRGAKSLGDKIDAGSILLNTTQEDLEALSSILAKGYEKPDTKISIYKNRRGEFNKMFLWCKSNKGTCRFIPMFATDYDYKLIDIKDTKIEVKE